MNQSEQSKAATQKKTSHKEVLAIAASALVDADRLADVAVGINQVLISDSEIKEV